MLNYSIKRISPKLLEEIESALRLVKPFGSVEIYVQNSIVTQITARNIKKTNVELIGDSEHQNKP